jgi:protein-tyrosine phosphatase
MTSHVCFVCSANTCRSPMAALVFAEHVRREGLADRVRITSAGTGSWQVGQGIDPRAATALTARDYLLPGTAHAAREFGDDHRDADLVVAAAAEHVAYLRGVVRDPDRVRLLREFDPAAPPGAELADPYSGTAAAYEATLAVIERCVPGLLGWLRARP